MLGGHRMPVGTVGDNSNKYIYIHIKYNFKYEVSVFWIWVAGPSWQWCLGTKQRVVKLVSWWLEVRKCSKCRTCNGHLIFWFNAWVVRNEEAPAWPCSNYLTLKNCCSTSTRCSCVRKSPTLMDHTVECLRALGGHARKGCAKRGVLCDMQWTRGFHRFDKKTVAWWVHSLNSKRKPNIPVLPTGASHSSAGSNFGFPKWLQMGVALIILL